MIRGWLFVSGLGLAMTALGQSRVNPHRPDPAARTEEGSCSACHVKIPAPAAAPADAELRLSPAAVCATCHPGVPHQGADTHVGQPMPERVTWPAAEGHIACFTCHDVHRGTDAGNVRSKYGDALHALVERRSWAGHTQGVTLPGAGGRPLLRAPLEGGALCRTCHGGGP